MFITYQILDIDFIHQFLKNVDCIIGNSSSGIIEAHSLKTYSLNIGDRQKEDIRILLLLIVILITNLFIKVYFQYLK